MIDLKTTRLALGLYAECDVCRKMLAALTEGNPNQVRELRIKYTATYGPNFDRSESQSMSPRMAARITRALQDEHTALQADLLALNFAPDSEEKPKT